MVTLWACSAPAGAACVFDNQGTINKSAGNITYTLNGVADPGDLTAVETQEGDAGNQLGGLFNTGDASSHFAPDLNTDNEDNWSVSIPLALTSPSITIDDVVLDGDHFGRNAKYDRQRLADRRVF